MSTQPKDHSPESGFILLDAVCGASIACLFALGLCAATLQAHRSLRILSRSDDAWRAAQYVLQTLPTNDSTVQTGAMPSGQFAWRADQSTDAPPSPGRRGVTHLTITIADGAGKTVASLEARRLIK
jgi:hypothetical protein